MMNYLDDVDLKRLRIFDAVVKAGGFRAAEEVLNINGSTISKAIAELEGRLGVKLCKRGRAGFELTKQGEAVYQLSFKLFSAVGDYVSAVRKVDEIAPRTFRIAVVDNMIADPQCQLVLGLERLLKEEPNLKIDLKILASDDAPLSLLRGELDIAITVVFRNIAGLRVCHLYNDDVMPFVATQHDELWRKPELSLSDIAEWRLATYTHTDHHALQHSNDPEKFVFCAQIEGALILGLAGQHVALLPRFYAQPWVDSDKLKPININELCFDSPVSAVSKVNGPNQDLVDRLVDIMCSETIFSP